MRKLLIAALLFVGLVTGTVFFYLKGRGESQNAPVYLQSAMFDKYRQIAVVGESYRPSWFEQNIFRNETNESSRLQLFETLKKEGPSLVIFLGNMVGTGSSNDDWKLFDSLVQHFYAIKVPILSVMGEREYSGWRPWALANVESRFESLRGQKWHVLPYLNLAFVFLNSNASEMSSKEWSDQLEWYKSTLLAIDAQPQFEAALVFLHHPPLTNGDENSDTEAVKNDILPPFVEAKKTMMMIAGHTRAYEKFFESDKYFLVTGGGGAPRETIETGANEDLYKGVALRPFHFLLLQPVQGGVTLEVKGFQPDEANIRQIEKSYIPFR